MNNGNGLPEAQALHWSQWSFKWVPLQAVYLTSRVQIHFSSEEFLHMSNCCLPWNTHKLLFQRLQRINVWFWDNVHFQSSSLIKPKHKWKPSSRGRWLNSTWKLVLHSISRTSPPVSTYSSEAHELFPIASLFSPNQACVPKVIE